MRELRDAEKGDFENDFQNIVVACCFEMDFDTKVFDTVLSNCHRVVGGEMLDRR